MDLTFDRQHLWHPYTQLSAPGKVYPVVSADGVYLTLESGERLIDAMSSWWCCVHGYNHPVINQAITDQMGHMSHVMFGGLTHEPAIRLGKQLMQLTEQAFAGIFYADSGSVAVEVAMKMAAQYCHEQGMTDKKRFLTFAKGYHGDTFGAMSVCDPVTGMHHKFSRLLNQHIFIDSPSCGFNEAWQEHHIADFAEALHRHHKDIIAVIFEPIVQGAGGMNFYAPQYLKAVRALCDEYDVLLIFDEIATGFGRTGKMFAYQHAGVVPDIICLGKALTGGYMTLAAVMCQQQVVDGIHSAFMHGPTFMANPLACQVASASLGLLQDSHWQTKVRAIEAQLTTELSPLEAHPGVKEVRVLGAIGVIEMKQPVDVEAFQQHMVNSGVWIRPFMNLIYLMPPFIIEASEISHITNSIKSTLNHQS